MPYKSRFDSQERRLLELLEEFPWLWAIKPYWFYLDRIIVIPATEEVLRQKATQSHIIPDGMGWTTNLYLQLRSSDGHHQIVRTFAAASTLAELGTILPDQIQRHSDTRCTWETEFIVEVRLPDGRTPFGSEIIVYRSQGNERLHDRCVRIMKAGV